MTLSSEEILEFRRKNPKIYHLRYVALNLQDAVETRKQIMRLLELDKEDSESWEVVEYTQNEKGEMINFRVVIGAKKYIGESSQTT